MKYLLQKSPWITNSWVTLQLQSTSWTVYYTLTVGSHHSYRAGLLLAHCPETLTVGSCQLCKVSHALLIIHHLTVVPGHSYRVMDRPFIMQRPEILNWFMKQAHSKAWTAYCISPRNTDSWLAPQLQNKSGLISNHHDILTVESCHRYRVIHWSLLIVLKHWQLDHVTGTE